MNDILHDEWQGCYPSKWKGCYPSKWKGMIVPDAIRHPAKFSSRLISRIYEHMLSEGWLKPGDLVIDPFGGVALGALDAMRHGLRWRGVELEAKFAELGNQNIGFWNSKFSSMPHWCQDAIIFQGDSRHLLDVIAEAHTAETTPPYANDALGHAGVPNEIDEQKRLYSRIGEGSYSGAAKKAGGLVSSPPYAESIGNAEQSGIDWSKQKDRDTDHPHGWNGEGYSAAGAVGSPPYSEARIGQESGQEQVGHHDQYGPTPGQLGAMNADGFESAISSPPFRQQSGGAHIPKGMEITDPGLIDRHSAGNAASHGYGESDGQLANMGEGDFNSVVTSPPFENSDSRKPGPALLQSSERHHVGTSHFKQDWKPSDGNIANDSGDNFWLAARQIVEQVYLALRPGAHAVWVVKGFVKDKKIVDFPGQWQMLCEVVGFETVHIHHAMLTNHKGTSHTLDGGEVHHKTEAKSFFRRNGENKARAAKWWEESALTKKQKAHYIAVARDIKQAAYEADVAKNKDPKRVIRPPTENIILGKAQMIAWEEAGSPEVEISTSIDYETVLCMVRP